jgi:hypothetical protein
MIVIVLPSVDGGGLVLVWAYAIARPTQPATADKPSGLTKWIAALDQLLPIAHLTEVSAAADTGR